MKITLRRLTHRPVTHGRLTSDVEALGVRPGAVVLVHSSLSALGYVVGGARAVIRSLLAAVGPTGTLVLPTHSWEEMELGGRTFDVLRTRSCVGKIPETFRAWPGAVRSLHPTHSVAAVGPAATRLVAGHELASTPCGPDTPYARILDEDGQILLLGAGLESNTAFHTIEALCSVSYLMGDRPDMFEVIDQRGGRRPIAVNRHRAGIRRRFHELEEMLVAEGAARPGRVGEAKALLIWGKAFRAVMVPAVAADPSFLLAADAPSAP